MNEGAFSSFNGVMLGWMRETKKVYDGTLYNVFIGTTESNVGKQAQSIQLPAANGTIETSKIRAMEVARQIADLFDEMSDYNRDFNDYGYFRSYSRDAIKVIWNKKYLNEIRKIDLPAIFHKDGLIEKFEADSLNERYFGRTLVADDALEGGVIAGNRVVADKGVRSKVEKDIGAGSGNASAGTAAQHVFPGDLIPAGTTVGGSSAAFKYDECYVEEPDVICKVLVKLPPFMSAFEVGTTFFNPRSLTENHYLTFGHNSLAYLKNYPFVTVKEVNE